MMTNTHMIMGAALFGRKLSRHAWAGIAGGLLPDIPMYVIFAVLKFYVGMPEFMIFGVAYFHPYWQAANGIGHSLIFWPMMAAMCWFLRPREFGRLHTTMTATAVFAASASLHSAIDFLCHREDAHSHFLPFTSWKFISPVSYWDSAHYGDYFRIFEAILGLCMAIVLFRTYRNLIVRACVGLAGLLYIAVPLYFSLMH
jgi:hypothetical protein